MVDFAKELAQAASRKILKNEAVLTDSDWMNFTRNELLSRIFHVIPAVVDDDVVKLLKMDIKGPPSSDRLFSYDFHKSIVNSMNASVFWSPLIVHAFVLRPLEEIWAQETGGKTKLSTPVDQVTSI